MKKVLLRTLIGLTAMICTAFPSLAETSGVGGRFIMQDHTGQIITDSDFEGSYMLITFGYTYCPDICPTNLAEMSDVLDLLGPRGNNILPIFISVDPARDTADRMKEYLSHFHERFIGLTGSESMLKRLTASYKVAYKIHQPEGADADQYVVDHAAGMYLMGTDGKFLVKFVYGVNPKEMAKRIEDFL